MARRLFSKQLKKREIIKFGDLKRMNRIIVLPEGTPTLFRFFFEICWIDNRQVWLFSQLSLYL